MEWSLKLATELARIRSIQSSLTHCPDAPLKSLTTPQLLLIIDTMQFAAASQPEAKKRPTKPTTLSSGTSASFRTSWNRKVSKAPQRNESSYFPTVPRPDSASQPCGSWMTITSSCTCFHRTQPCCTSPLINSTKTGTQHTRHSWIGGSHASRFKGSSRTGRCRTGVTCWR